MILYINLTLEKMESSRPLKQFIFQAVPEFTFSHQANVWIVRMTRTWAFWFRQ